MKYQNYDICANVLLAAIVKPASPSNFDQYLKPYISILNTLSSNTNSSVFFPDRLTNNFDISRVRLRKTASNSVQHVSRF